jgi:hypothetical protein
MVVAYEKSAMAAPAMKNDRGALRTRDALWVVLKSVASAGVEP